MLDRKRIKLEYKEKVHPMGIYKITNKANGKIFIRKSKDIEATSNRFEFGKRIEKCFENELQEDFQKFGANKFKFETLEQLKIKNNPNFDKTKELTILENKWLTKLKPYNSIGYNKLILD